jgi:hypothetical protein
MNDTQKYKSITDRLIDKYKLFITSTIGFFVVFQAFPATRIGDGSDYVLQFEAARKSFTPWVTQNALTGYQQLVQRNEILGLVSGTSIADKFPSLHTGNIFDLNHFWLYSSLAAVLNLIFRLIFVELSVNSSFVLLHAIVFGMLIQVAKRRHKYFGVLSVLLLFVGSPMFWFGNKIHTEFITISLVTLASIYVMNKEYLLASIALSFAGTQNPSFSAIAIILLGFHIYEVRGLGTWPKDYFKIFLSIFVSSIHPIYYLVRHGVVTPQLKAGGASTSADFQNILIWILDPDVGLIPNWLLGLILVIAIPFVLGSKLALDLNLKKFSIFTSAFVLISLYAQSSTQNINSGGTTGPSRYGFWYIGLFFPIALLFLTALIKHSASLIAKISFVVLAIVILSALYSFFPLRPESYTNPTSLSRVIQTHASEYYSPPIEVFVERYSGLGESAFPSTVGPDCRKLAVSPRFLDQQVVSPKHCLFSESALSRFVGKIDKVTEKGFFYRLRDDEAENLKFEVSSGDISFNAGSPDLGLLLSGWSEPEAWGVWSVGKFSRLAIPCLISGVKAKTIQIKLSSFGDQSLTISNHKSSRLVSLNLIGKQLKLVEIKLQDVDCELGFHLLNFDLPESVSPASLGISDDQRILGVGLIRVYLEP